ncbi:hypothetical protein B9Z19DRAFT_1073764 [Tuber borchii]|uniref:Uncharacterized protein n=1 Tax=Tuber borchii TaxID=42251 RepID=A0A2T7A5R6_TUBBO|nr:hypothetical protein B9Z19DRAFT_1073764 [Tuber borchii]
MILRTTTSHYATALNHGEGTEELRKVPTRKCIPEGISPTEGREGAGRINSGRFGFLGSEGSCVLATLPGRCGESSVAGAG